MPLLLIVASQLSFMTASFMLFTFMPIVGQSLASDPKWANLPLAACMAVMVLCTFPLSLWMIKHGRGVPLRVGMAINIAAAFLIALAIQEQHFLLIIAACGLFGIGSTCANFFRFAAMELVEPPKQGFAISMIMAVGVVAAVLGPNLAKFSQQWQVPDFYATGYLIMGLSVFALLLLLPIRFATPKTSDQAIPDAPICKPNLYKTIFCATTAFFVMALIMTATPLHMHHHHHDFEQTAWVIQWHMLGMYAPAFITAPLIKRLGQLKLQIIGAVILLLSLLVNLIGESVTLLTLGLFLLGVGWNFLFIGASTQLASLVKSRQAKKWQGINDFIVFSAATLAVLGSAWLLTLVSWQWLNLMMIVMPLACIVILSQQLLTKKQSHVQPQSLSQTKTAATKP